MSTNPINRRIADWLETHWVAPSYSGWLLGSLSIFFFMAATNTMAGWLYVISGIGFALLAIAAILPARSLRHLEVSRRPISPVSVGEHLTVELHLHNSSPQPKSLLQVRDQLPSMLAPPQPLAIEAIDPHNGHHWIYCQPAQRRGVYRWHTVELRTAAPLGLFWCRRNRTVKATAVVYPTVLPLVVCPLLDELGRDTSLQLQSDRRAQVATEGLTRSLRSYRWGDPIRLVHWRTSARYGELRVRELEIFTGGQEVVIGLDSATDWRTAADPTFDSPADFEQAVVAAASLYFYACRRNLNVRLWTAGTGLLQNRQVVLEALAEVQAGEDQNAGEWPDLPFVWLTCRPASLATLPANSRWLLWPGDQPLATWQPQVRAALGKRPSSGLVIRPQESLQQQLQAPVGIV